MFQLNIERNATRSLQVCCRFISEKEFITDNIPDSIHPQLSYPPKAGESVAMRVQPR